MAMPVQVPVPAPRRGGRRRRSLAALAPHAALWALLAAMWVGNARRVAGKVADRCFGAGGRSRGEECRLSLVLPSVVAVYSLVVLAALWLQEGEYQLPLEDAAGADDDDAPLRPMELLRPRPPVSEGDDLVITDADAVLLVVCVCTGIVAITALGAVLLLIDREKVSLVGRLGYLCAEGGCLGFSVAICVLIIPYMYIRLMRLHRGTDHTA